MAIQVEQSQLARIKAGMKIVLNVARKYSDTTSHLDIIGAGNEAVVLADRSWDETKGPWVPWCIRYVKEYTRAERSKMNSVVCTNYKKRVVDSDASTLVEDAEGGGWEDTTVSPANEAAAIEARHDLKVHLTEMERIAAGALPLKHQHLAAVLVQRTILPDTPSLTLSAIADATGVQRQAVHRAGQAVTAALREEGMLPEVSNDETDDLL